MRFISLRYRIKGKLKFVLILLFTISVLFITYQFLYYITLIEYQSEDSRVHFQQQLLKKEIPVKQAVDTKETFLKAPKLPIPAGKPLIGSILGVAPEYWKYYNQQTLKFSCLSSKSRKISWDKVNDDYCDCPVDGSDEPSTSACMNGMFYCTKSLKSYPEYIPSSRVNDKICDCCDGSDEYLNKSACKSTMASRTVMNTVYNHIRSRILLGGPITVADYMKISLTMQQRNLPGDDNSSLKGGGYYMTRDVLGQHGDFITSPEISQLFGEMIGVWGISTWRRIGGPKKINIVELGPGRGTLAKDVLRVFHKLKKNDSESEIELHLVEISPYFTKLQEETLCGPMKRNDTSSKKIHLDDDLRKSHFTLDNKTPVFWHRQLSTVPKGFNFYIAHEFFDALPIHKLQRTDNGWREILVDVDHTHPHVVPQTNPNEKLRFVISRNETPVIQLLKSHYPSILETSRSQIEFSIAAASIYDTLSQRLNEDGGFSLIVDYGHEGDKGDTFRGFYRHQLQNPLENPGYTDLTADIDFSILRTLTQNQVCVIGPISQAEFLSRTGIQVRLTNLISQIKNEKEREELVSGYKMLMEEMGNRFKCVVLLPKILERYRPKLKITAFDQE